MENNHGELARSQIHAQQSGTTAWFCVLLIEASDKVDYIFSSLHLFPVSLAVNKEVESLGETALIIKFRIFIYISWFLLSLSLYLCRYSLYPLFSHNQPTITNYSWYQSMYIGFWQFLGLKSNSQVVLFQVLAKVLTTKHLRNEGLATVICSLNGNIRNHTLIDFLGLLQSLELLGMCFICREIFTYLRLNICI